jgi:hypothetical protein
MAGIETLLFETHFSETPSAGECGGTDAHRLEGAHALPVSFAWAENNLKKSWESL